MSQLRACLASCMDVASIYGRRLRVRSPTQCMVGSMYGCRLSLWSSASCTVIDLVYGHQLHIWTSPKSMVVGIVVNSVYRRRLHVRLLPSFAKCAVIAQNPRSQPWKSKILRNSCGTSLRRPRSLNWHSTTSTLRLVKHARPVLRKTEWGIA